MSLSKKFTLIFVVFFIFITIAIGTLCYYVMTKTMEKDKAVINLAGRQRMLIEKYAKEHLLGLLPLQVRHSTLTAAEVAALQITKERKLYTEDIIGKLKKREAPEVQPESGYAGINSDYHLPGTFRHGVSSVINRKKLYSYELLSRWNINKEKGLNTDFENEAYDYFLKNDGNLFYRFVEYNGNYTLRYATPDIATADVCIRCHNSHEESRKHDFSLGDLMGILVVNIPVGPVNIGIASVFGDLEKGEHSRDKFVQTKKVFDITLEALINGGDAPLDLEMNSYMFLSKEGDSAIINKLKEVKSYWDNIQENIEKLSNVALNSAEYLVAYNATGTSVDGGLVAMNEAVSLLQKKSDKKAILLLWWTLGGFLGITFMTVGFCWTFLISRYIVKPIQKLTSGTRLIAEGRLDQEIEIKSEDEIGVLTQNFNNMLYNIREYRTRIEMNNWLQTGKAELNERIPGERDIASLGGKIISHLAEYLRAQIGAIYIAEEENLLRLVGSYACSGQNVKSKVIKFGEGLVGQSALEKKYILLNNSPEDYAAIHSALGEALPKNIILFPFQMDSVVKGVIELGSLYEFTDNDITFLEHVSRNIAISINSHMSSEKMATLLERTQEQAANLKLSEERLQGQHEELKASNEELESKAIVLKEQRNALDQKNSDVEKARKEIEQKAEEVELANKFKSEFLSNMSHELRTPLNSLLILAKLLFENKDQNLTEKQVDFAKTIYRSGNELLELINDILDLSKVEAGKLEINREEIHLPSFIGQLEKTFLPVAKENGLEFSATISDNVPEMFCSDSVRLAQIIKNFLSNSFKFTTKGEVCLAIEKTGNEVAFFDKNLSTCKAIAFKVKDTGIGLSKEKQEIIFEAFRQADSRTCREYGGTGLGLSISRELAKLLGGEILLDSEEGKGSTFSLILPVYTSDRGVLAGEDKETAVVCIGGDLSVAKENRLKQYSDSIIKGDSSPERQKDEAILCLNKVEEELLEQQGNTTETVRTEEELDGKTILIVDDDMRNVYALSNVVQNHGMSVVVGKNGRDGIDQLEGNSGVDIVLMDIMMPEMDGYEAMREIRGNNEYKSLPIIALTAKAMKGEKDRCTDAGANDYMSKPVDTEQLLSLIRTWVH